MYIVTSLAGEELVNISERARLAWKTFSFIFRPDYVYEMKLFCDEIILFPREIILFHRLRVTTALVLLANVYITANVFTSILFLSSA